MLLRKLVALTALVYFVSSACVPNGVCDVETENCLTCPQDCSCSFSGLRLDSWACAPNTNCPMTSDFTLMPAISNFMASTPGAVTGRLSGYIIVDDFVRLTLRIDGQNVGARLNVDGSVIINAYFPQAQISSSAHVSFQPGAVHFFILDFFSMSNSTARSIQLLSAEEGSGEFSHLHGSFYNVKICGDQIPDAGENCAVPDNNRLISDQFTLLDCYTMNCTVDLTEYCGNATQGVCMEQFPENCFVDCHHRITKTCSAVAPMHGHIAPGFHTSMDTLGDLIYNQMMWHLPGIEHMAHGFNIITGEESTAPLFYFGYCGDYVQRAVQDTYRDSFYVLPDEVFAQLTPQCAFSASSTVYSSATEFASTLAVNTASSFSMNFKAGFDLGDWFPLGSVNVDLSLAMSNERSVQSAVNLKRKESGSVVVTEAKCEVSKVQLSKFNLHPTFLEELSTVQTEDDILPLMEKYGTHFYNTATLGGRLRQVTVLNSAYESTQSEFETKTHADISFAASISGSFLGSSASLSAELAGSLDSSTTSAQQSTYESSSSRSTIITYGGPPGSFGPDSADAPSNFGDWASAVDLLPVPIDYQLVPVFNAISDQWKTKNGTSLRSLWKAAEPLFRQKISPLAEDAKPYKYSMYWQWQQNSNITDYYVTKPNSGTFDWLTSGVTNNIIIDGVSHTIMDQSSGSYAPFNFRLHAAPINSPNPIEFIFSSSVLPVDGVFSLMNSKLTGLSLSSQRSFFFGSRVHLLDWQTGNMSTIISNEIGSGSTVFRSGYTLNNFPADTLNIFFNMEQVNNNTFMPSNSYWEIVFYGVYNSQSRIFRYTKSFTENFQSVPNQNLLLNIPVLPIASPSAAQVSASLMGEIKQVEIRLGSVRNSATDPGKVDFRIRHLWVSSLQPTNFSPSGLVNTMAFRKVVYAMPVGKSIYISNHDSDSTRVVLTPLKELKR